MVIIHDEFRKRIKDEKIGLVICKEILETFKIKNDIEIYV